MSQTRCSFCDKSTDEVVVMIQGTAGAYICDECAELCVEVVREKKAGLPPPPRPEISTELREALRGLRKMQREIEKTSVPPRIERLLTPPER